MSDPTDRVFLVETRDQTMRITVPAGYKMTFGPLLPFETKARVTSRYETSPILTTAIRVYRTKDEPVMVIPHVVQFREIGPLKVELMDVDAKGKEVWKEDTKGEIERSQRRRKAVANAIAHNGEVAIEDVSF